MHHLLAICLLLTTAAAQHGLAGIVRTIDGRSLQGRLTVGEDGRASLAGGASDQPLAPVTIDLAELTAFEVANAKVTRMPAPHRIWLRSGQELPAVALAGRPAADGKQAMLAWTSPGGLQIAVPLATVRAIRHAGDGRPQPALFEADLQRPPASDDLIYVVKDGKAQRSAVTVTGLGSDRIDFLLRGDSYDFELSGLCAIVFGANTGLAPDRQGSPRCRLELVSGDSLEGRLLLLDTNIARCRLDEGEQVDVPVAALARIVVASDRVAWLSDLSPKVEQTPAFDRVWPWTIDRSIGGPGFIVGGKQFRRGIGLVPRTRLSYELGGRFDRFEASVGIDDRGGPDAHAVLRVFVDDKLAWESAPQTHGQAPESVRVELQKAQRLAIEADFGRNFDLGDHCVFADARVIQK